LLVVEVVSVDVVALVSVVADVSVAVGAGTAVSVAVVTLVSVVAEVSVPVTAAGSSTFGSSLSLQAKLPATIRATAAILKRFFICFDLLRPSRSGRMPRES
jgi:hypothetical protein